MKHAMRRPSGKIRLAGFLLAALALVLVGAADPARAQTTTITIGDATPNGGSAGDPLTAANIVGAKVPVTVSGNTFEPRLPEFLYNFDINGDGGKLTVTAASLNQDRTQITLTMGLASELDADIPNATLSIEIGAFENIPVPGSPVQATNTFPPITLATTGPPLTIGDVTPSGGTAGGALTEANIDGATAVVTVSGGEFADVAAATLKDRFSITGAGGAIGVASLTRDGDAQVTLTLSRAGDFEEDIEGAAVRAAMDAFADAPANAVISSNTLPTIAAVDEPDLELSLSTDASGALDEGDTFTVTATRAAGDHLEAVTVPLGLYRSAIQTWRSQEVCRVGGNKIHEPDILIAASSASGSMTFQVCDDDDPEPAESVWIRLREDPPEGYVDATPDNLKIDLAANDPTTLTIGDVTPSGGAAGDDLTRANIAGTTVVVTASNGRILPFSDDWLRARFSITGADDAIGIASLTRDGATQVTLTLSRASDFDEDIEGAAVRASGDVFEIPLSDAVTSSNTLPTIAATPRLELSLSTDASGVLEEGASFTLTATRAAGDHSAAVTIRLASYSAATGDTLSREVCLGQAQVSQFDILIPANSASGTESRLQICDDDDAELAESFYVRLRASPPEGYADATPDNLEIDIAASDLPVVTIGAVTPSGGTAGEPLTEQNIDGATAVLTVSNGEFWDGSTAQLRNYFLIVGDGGAIGVSSLTRDSDTQVTLTLSRDIDFDADIEGAAVNIEGTVFEPPVEAFVRSSNTLPTIVAVVDDDLELSLSTDASGVLDEGDSFTITVTRAPGDHSAPADVSYLFHSAATGAALNETDVCFGGNPAASASVRIAASAASHTETFQVCDDDDAEPAESVWVRFRDDASHPLPEGHADATPDNLKIDIAETLSGSLDVDGNGEVGLLTDGLLLVRYLIGARGLALTAGALAVDASEDRNEPEEIAAYLQGLEEGGVLDVDGNGEVGLLTDGLLLVRYLIGARGLALTAGALAVDASEDRNEPGEIVAYLDSIR